MTTKQYLGAFIIAMLLGLPFFTTFVAYFDHGMLKGTCLLAFWVVMTLLCVGYKQVIQFAKDVW